MSEKARSHHVDPTAQVQALIFAAGRTKGPTLTVIPDPTIALLKGSAIT